MVGHPTDMCLCLQDNTLEQTIALVGYQGYMCNKDKSMNLSPKPKSRMERSSKL